LFEGNFSVITGKWIALLHGVVLCALLMSCNIFSESQNENNKTETVGQSAKRPNFLLIVADDLGFSDLGVLGGEIHTPNIDRLAREGLLLTNFYAGGSCSPTRAMLLTGVDQHRAGFGTMTAHIAPNQVGQPGYEGYLNDRVISLPEILRDAGYNTYATGKWHLGNTEETSPRARGFEKSFILVPGGAGHFDQTGLSANRHPAFYREDGAKVDLPEDFFYSTDFYTRKMISYIEEGRKSNAPFFAYLSYTAPHWPLQAPKENIAKYEGVYNEGWQAIQQARLKELVDAGIMPPSTKIPAIYTNTRDWDGLSAEQKRIEIRKMEIYAGMVDRLDQQIGTMIDYLKKTQQLDNTVIIFLSDNGAEGAPLYEMPALNKWMNSFDNSYENLGAKGSYVFYEERWAQVSMTPFRLYKGMASEGGVHVPAFVTYGGFENQAGRHESVTSVMDITPTIMDIARIPDHSGEYKGKKVHPIQGRSWLPVLNGNAEMVRSDRDGYAWESFNYRGYRRGKWKALHLHEPFGPGQWQLYDLSIDPGETNNLASQYPDILTELVTAWETYADENGVILGNRPAGR
jgi:arylsulfatase